MWNKIRKKRVPVDPKILSLNPYPTLYCPKWNLYIWDPTTGPFLETTTPIKMGNHITEIQKRNNERFRRK